MSDCQSLVSSMESTNRRGSPKNRNLGIENKRLAASKLLDMIAIGD